MGKRKDSLLGADDLVDGCLGTLRALGKTVNAQLATRRGASVLWLKFGTRAAPLIFEVRVTRTHLSYPLANGLIQEAKSASAPWLLLAPYVSAQMGHHLVSQRVSYVDAVGNCHLETDGLVVAHVEGKKIGPKPSERSPGLTSHQLLFALIAQPDLVDAPVRRIALAAGIGKSAALEHLERLNAESILDYHPATGFIYARELLDRWVTAYANAVRPSWLMTRCRPRLTDSLALDELIERVCSNRIWAFGGAAAAHRMLNSERGTETVLHVSEVSVALLEQLRAVPATDGPLTILRTRGAIAYRGMKPHLAHPLLVYSELLTVAEPNAVRAAQALREQLLAEAA